MFQRRAVQETDLSLIWGAVDAIGVSQIAYFCAKYFILWLHGCAKFVHTENKWKWSIRAIKMVQNLSTTKKHPIGGHTKSVTIALAC